MSACGRPRPASVSSQPTGWKVTPRGSASRRVYFSSVLLKSFRSFSSPPGEPRKTRYWVRDFGTASSQLSRTARRLTDEAGLINILSSSLATERDFIHSSGRLVRQAFPEPSIPFQMPLAAHRLSARVVALRIQQEPNPPSRRPRARSRIVARDAPLEIVGPSDVRPISVDAAATEHVNETLHLIVPLSKRERGQG